MMTLKSKFSLLKEVEDKPQVAWDYMDTSIQVLEHVFCMAKRTKDHKSFKEQLRLLIDKRTAMKEEVLKHLP